MIQWFFDIRLGRSGALLVPYNGNLLTCRSSLVYSLHGLYHLLRRAEAGLACAGLALQIKVIAELCVGLRSTTRGRTRHCNELLVAAGHLTNCLGPTIVYNFCGLAI